MKTTIQIVLCVLLLCSCDRGLKNSTQLSSKDKDYIKTLGILDNDESIILFDSQAPVKTSGNFFTEKRIASYWIDDRDENKNSIETAFYMDIDTMWRYPKYKSLTLASYLEVQRKNGTKFQVYVSEDSIKTWEFFNRALEEWYKKSHANKP